MTYCIALNLEQGLVFASDSRTNAGVDDIRRAGKMRLFGNDGERLIVPLSADSRAVTRTALTPREHRPRHDMAGPGIDTAPSLFEVAQHIGEAMREIPKRADAYWREDHIDPSAS